MGDFIMLTSDTLQSRHGKLFGQDGSGSGKKLSLDQEEHRRGLSRSRAGWQALCAWLQMPESELGEAKSRALADAGFSMIDNPELRAAALLDIAQASLREDKLSGWNYCIQKGLDPAAAKGFRADAGALLRHMGRERSSWLALAISTDSWICAVALARSPHGKVGLPNAGDSMESQGACIDSKAKLGRANIDQARQEDPRLDLTMLQSEAEWHLENHPSLIEWERGLRGEKKFPAGLRKALKEGGFAPLWGDRLFCFAAAQLALRGSCAALAGCVANGVSCKMALLAGDHGELDLRGGLLGEKQGGVAWGPVSEWIDSCLGAGSSEKMVEDRAFDLALATSGRHGSWVADGRAAKALSWLESHPCQRIDRCEQRIIELQGLALELSQGDKGWAGSTSSKVKELISKWEGARAEPPKPRRLLKA